MSMNARQGQASPAVTRRRTKSDQVIVPGKDCRVRMRKPVGTTIVIKRP